MEKSFIEGSLVHITRTYKGEEDEQECDIYQIINDDGVGFFIDKETIGQFTGLKDKNGKEIYEGDIVKIKSNPLDMTGYIIYDEYDLAFELRDDENESQECLWYQEQELEVIGNIYDNPDLLEKGEQS